MPVVKDRPATHGPDQGLAPVRHLADHKRDYEFTLCGLKRDRPLSTWEATRGDQFCVVCMDIYEGRHT